MVLIIIFSFSYFLISQAISRPDDSEKIRKAIKRCGDYDHRIVLLFESSNDILKKCMRNLDNF